MEGPKGEAPRLAALVLSRADGPVTPGEFALDGRHTMAVVVHGAADVLFAPPDGGVVTLKSLDDGHATGSLALTLNNMDGGVHTLGGTFSARMCSSGGSK